MVPDKPTRTDVDCNGVAKDFTIEWPFLEDSHLKVLLTLKADPADVVELQLGVHYTVTGAGSETGGTVHTLAVYSSAYRISVIPDVPFDQTTEYEEGADFPAKSHERALDKLTMLARQLKEGLARAVRGAENAAANYQLPPPIVGHALGWLPGPILGNVVSEPVQFAAALVDATDPAKGAGMSGMGYGVAYPAGTVGWAVGKGVQQQTAAAAVTSGTAPNFTVTGLSPAITAYTEPLEIEVKFHANGTLGSNTIDFGPGALNLKQLAGNGAKIPGDVRNGMVSKIRYDGADALILNPLSTPGSLAPQSGALTVNFTLSALHIGRMQILGGAGLTVTLPTTNSIPSGACFTLKNEGTGRATIALNSNTISDCPSLVIERGETVILQSDGDAVYRLVSRTSRGMPNYSNVASSGHAFGTVYQVDSDSTIVGIFEGQFVNAARLYIGPTSSPTIVAGQVGDDTNTNTKSGWISAQIPMGWYFKWDNTQYTAAFETVSTIVYRNH